MGIPVRASRSGFSLMELLVVITIIAILASLLMPVLQTIKESAFMTRCASNERQVVAALLAYTNDNEGYFPVLCNPVSPSYSWATPTFVNTLFTVGQFSPQEWRVYYCPSDWRHPTNVTQPRSYGGNGAIGAPGTAGNNGGGRRGLRQ